jgi:hypothetical protein
MINNSYTTLLAGSIAYVEQAMPFPKDGKQGWYITGYGYGIWLGILAAAGFKVVPVPARVWKGAMGLCGKEFTKVDSSPTPEFCCYGKTSKQM